MDRTIHLSTVSKNDKTDCRDSNMFPSIEPNEVGNTGLLWLFMSYGFVLFQASNLISEGSELLLLVPSLAGLVGGVVLPLLGAVPDGAIMLFSGLGDIATAQETLSVGVGALAGSTIMLLTVPWGLSVMAGQVDLVKTNNQGDVVAKYRGDRKLTEGKSMSEVGVSITDEIKHGSKIMILTTIPYFLIQIPCSFLEGEGKTGSAIASGEKYWALVALVICVTSFVAYLHMHIKASKDDEQKLRRMEVMKDLLKKGKISLGGAFHGIVEVFDDNHTNSDGYQTIETTYNEPSEKVLEYLRAILRAPFQKYDVDGDKTLQKREVKVFLADFHEKVTDEDLDILFARYDTDGNGAIDFEEFVGACYAIITNSSKVDTGSKDQLSPSGQAERNFSYSAAANVLEDEEEEEEMPHDIAQLPAEQQEAAVKKKAFTMLALGTFLVLLFSDPMVEVMSEIAVRVDISPFYVSFILAPLASNASEVLASTYYASKKTSKTITVSFSALQGAACMNNTFCLSIFMALIYFRGLAWQYTAETISIVLIQFIIYFMTRGSVMSTMQGMMILCIFPLSIVFVATLTAIGLD